LDRIFKENEIKMEQKNVRIDELESLMKINGIPVPKEEKEKQLKSIRNSFADFTRQKSLQTYQDDPKIEEVYTVTEKNLELEQKMNELTQKNQKYETQINLLQSELQNIQNNISQENSVLMNEIQ
jgi:predicted  nucleic acid-binding Zn-ribbon protein